MIFDFLKGMAEYAIVGAIDLFSSIWLKKLGNIALFYSSLTIYGSFCSSS